MLGSRTQGGRMEGADESTELWRHPLVNNCYSKSLEAVYSCNGSDHVTLLCLLNNQCDQMQKQKRSLKYYKSCHESSQLEKYCFS